MNKIIKKLRIFSKLRNWEQQHTLKNLSVAIGIEVSELQEQFLWNDTLIDNAHVLRIKDEIADIFIYLLIFCDQLGMDEKQIHTIITNKIKINDARFPIPTICVDELQKIKKEEHV